jgi:cytochrome c oxidase subunit 3
MATLVRPGINHRPPPPPVEHGWGGGGSPGWRGADRRAAFVGLFLLLASTAMVFAAFTVAFLARRDVADYWVSMPKPRLLLVNTAVLMLSSIVLDGARRALRAGDRARLNFWWSGATALGVLFLAGQVSVWRQLSHLGLYVATSPATSFFYVLTMAHAVHVVGGLSALVYVDWQAWRLRLGPAKRTVIDVSALFWHFLGGVWLFLLLVLYIWG